MGIPAGSEPADEIYTIVASVGATYGDPNNSYAKWLLQNAGSGYVADASFLWNQPLFDNGLVHANATASGSASGAVATGKTHNASGDSCAT